MAMPNYDSNTAFAENTTINDSRTVMKMSYPLTFPKSCISVYPTRYANLHSVNEQFIFADAEHIIPLWCYIVFDKYNNNILYCGALVLLLGI